MFSLSRCTLSALTLLSLLPRHSFARSLVFDDYASRHAMLDTILDTHDTHPVARDGDSPPASPKLVVAHFMVGNTYPYVIDDWIRDIKLAASKQINAFALNLGADDWEGARIADAFIAADRTNRELGTSFKLFLSFDMSAIPCNRSEDASLVRKYINVFGGTDSYLMYHDKPLVSTYAGESCTFGQDSLDKAWLTTLRTGASRDVTFVPFFNMDPIGFGELTSVDGIFNWNSGWPREGKDLDFYSDQLHISDLGGRVYMAAVSPWFFTHYGPDSFNKNWMFNSDDWMFAQRLEMLAEHRDHIDIVQVISWNDFGESHYVGPIEGAQPMSEAWTTGYDHTPFLEMLNFYLPAFTSGQDVSKSIDKDQVFVWGRLSPAGATTDDPIPKPDGAQDAEDAAWAVVHLTESALVTLSCGSASQTFPLDAGESKIKLDLHEDCALRVVINKSGQNTMDWSPEGYKFNTHPTTYNFNCFVAVS